MNMLSIGRVRTINQCDRNIDFKLTQWGQSTEQNIVLFTEILGLWLKKKRLQFSMTQTEVGKLMNNVSFQQVQKYEKKTNDIPFLRLYMFCEATKTNISEFLNIFINKSIKVETLFNNAKLNEKLYEGVTHEQSNA